MSKLDDLLREYEGEPSKAGIKDFVLELIDSTLTRDWVGDEEFVSKKELEQAVNEL
jgi:hypothetical protein